MSKSKEAKAYEKALAASRRARDRAARKSRDLDRAEIALGKATARQERARKEFREASQKSMAAWSKSKALYEQCMRAGEGV